MGYTQALEVIVVGLESTGDGRDYRQDTTFARAHSSQSQASQELAWAALHGLRSSLVKERISEPVNIIIIRGFIAK